MLSCILISKSARPFLVLIPLRLFSLQHRLMVFYWSLWDSKFPKVSRTLLSNLLDLNSAVVWIVCTRCLFSIAPSPFKDTLVIIPSTLVTIGITVIFMLHSFCFFFNSLKRSRYLSLFLQFYSMVCRDGKVKNSASSVFSAHYHIVWSSCRNYMIRFYFKISENFVSHFPGRILGRAYTISSHGQI